jgi:uncharacterized LabA/DUF88 family protein
MASYNIPTRKYIVLADGENLVHRYQALLPRKILNPNVKHIEDVFVWHQNVAAVPGWTPLRVNYYTSAVGTDEKIAEIEKKISEVQVEKKGEYACQICPRVFKRPKQANKTKIVDISIAIDALRHSYHGHVEAIMLLSGDGDYLPLVKEVMRNGTQLWLGAFSDGLNAGLPPAVDRFINLDAWFYNGDRKN